MRPLDLLILRADEDHKNLMKQFVGENIKISKQFELYTWGRVELYNLGYPHPTEENRRPTKVSFNPDLEEPMRQIADVSTSVKDIKVSDSFSLALTSEGRLYSWGMGLHGKLGHGGQNT
jgi:alpha-tubulin suppressor-like RCC1 family protein